MSNKNRIGYLGRNISSLASVAQVASQNARNAQAQVNIKLVQRLLSQAKTIIGNTYAIE